MVKSISMMQKKRGFTLIELIVILAVLAIIMAIALPRFGGVKDEAKYDADMATLASIAKLAEFEYVRQDLASKGSNELENPSLSELIERNYTENDLFQSERLKGVNNKEDFEVEFDEEGKVTKFTIGSDEYLNEGGKFVPDTGQNP